MITVNKTIPGNINPTNLRKQLVKSSIKSKFDHIEKINHNTGEVTFIFDDDFDAADEVVLDNLIGAHDEEDEQDPLLLEIVDPSVQSKSHISINYNTELADNVTLYKEDIFYDAVPNRGQLKDVIYYHNYVDSTNKGQEILKVTHTWNVDTNSSTIPASMTTTGRASKEWKYMKADGSYHSITKIKPLKPYDTFKKSNDEGKRKRHNIINQAKESIGAAMLFSGGAATPIEVNIKLTSLWKHFASELSAYIESGEETFSVTGEQDIYKGIEDCTDYSWLDLIVPDIAQTQALIPTLIGMAVRDVIIKKLKGEI